MSDHVFSILLVAGLALVIGAIEIARAPWRGLPPSQASSNVILSRAAFKLLGFIVTLAVIGFLYWLFPEYHRTYYRSFFESVGIVLPWFILLAIPYFVYVEWRLPKEEGGMWNTALFATARWSEVDWSCLRQHALGWLVKAFFLPIMFGDIVNNIGALRVANWDLASLDFVPVFTLLFDSLILLELVFVSAGYVFTCRLFDSHIRRVEDTLFGWTVALISYTPFLGLFYVRYFNYSADNIDWLVWLGANPKLVVAWGSAILVLLFLHLWSDACFGLRFSNLTNRGIITNGPFRFCKHPAYLIKNLRWWLVSVPFIALDPVEGLRLSLLLVCVNMLYTVRGYTEEKLLSRDPTYVAYAKWMEDHSLLRFLKRIPIFSYEWRLARWQRMWPDVYPGV